MIVKRWMTYTSHFVNISEKLCLALHSTRRIYLRGAETQGLMGIVIIVKIGII